jgi:flagellar basal-body rod modification protein FlgD
VRTIEVGKKAAGPVRFTWDGRSDDGLVMPAGTYTVAVKASKEDGTTVGSTQETTGTVKSVSFDKGYPVLQLSNGSAVPISDLLKVQ